MSGQAKVIDHRKSLLIGAAIVVVVSIAFMFTYVTRFAGLRSGSGCFVAGLLMLDGVLPNRDYFCMVPFLSVIKEAIVIQIFGKYLIVSRMMGVCLRVFLGLLTYFWLSRFVRVPVACWSTVFCLIFCCGDISDGIDMPSFDMIFWAAAAGFATSFSLTANRSVRAFKTISFFAGVLCGMCLLTKQTLGIGISFFLPVLTTFCFIRLNELKKAKLYPFVFALGWLLVIGVGAGWLVWIGAWQSFLMDNFISGPRGKGNILLNHAKFMAFYWPLNLVALVAAILVQKSLREFLNRPADSANSDEGRSASLRSFIAVLICPLLAVAWGTVVDCHGFITAVYFLCRCVQIALIYFVQYTLLIFVASLLLKRATIKTQRQVQILFLAMFSFTCSCFVSLSFPAYEPMTIPSIGFIMAALLETSGRRRARLLYVGACLVITVVTLGKSIRPFGFSEISELPVRIATVPSTVPMLKGLSLPKEVVEFLDGTTQIVNENSDPKDKIFAYPEIAILYSTTGRLCPTRSFSHNIDIMSYEFCLSEAKLLLENKPAVLVYGRMTDKEQREQESFWRNGKRSGLRHITAACDQLAREYYLARTFHVCNRDIEVYVRPDRTKRKDTGI